ncbi:MAG: SRPBCC domain-containing protein, partial [Polyangiaceae bacterium]
LMDGRQHAAFTGAAAKCAAKKGGAFEAWDGYISGKNLELVPGEKIVQSWRATDFPPEYPDSTLEIELTPESGGTKLRLRHTQLPEKRVEFYHSGWHDHYWQPLRAWLTMRDSEPPTLRMTRPK